jgi:hypothetical protein
MMPEKMSSDAGARFCPACGLAYGGRLEGSLCPECGETLARQGYCPVCEAFWPLRPGEPCPKHDIPLERECPAPVVAGEPGDPVSWTTVAVYPNSLAAAIPRSRLESEHIPTFLDGERIGNVGIYHSATRGVRLQVPADRVADARIILSQKWSLPDDEKADFEDLL